MQWNVQSVTTFFASHVHSPVMLLNVVFLYPASDPLFQSIHLIYNSKRLHALVMLMTSTTAAFPSYSPPGQQNQQGFENGASTETDFPIPPGSEFVLPDPQGRLHRFKVQYKYYTMTRRVADMWHLSAAASPYAFFSENPWGGSSNPMCVDAK